MNKLVNISIIVPVYNVEKYLEECLNSLLNQEFDNYEIVCVEDKSTDNSLDILEQYKKKSSKIKIIKNFKNMGLSATRNIGLREAKGKYVLFVDSDDMVKPGSLKILYNLAESNMVDVVYFNMEFLNDEENGLIREKVKNKTYDGIYTGMELFCRYIKENDYKVEAWRKFIKRDVLIENGIFFYEGIINEDMLFSFLLAVKSEKAMDLNKELYIYRQRKGSIMWSQRKEKASNSLFISMINMISYWMANSFSEHENRCISKFIKDIYKNYLYYKDYSDNDFPKFSNKEKLIKDIFSDKYFPEVKFNKEDLITLFNSKMNMLYGAGRRAVEVLNTLNALNIKVDYILVTNKSNNAKSINGIEVKELREMTDFYNSIVILSADEKYQDEITKDLKENKFNNIIKPIVEKN